MLKYLNNVTVFSLRWDGIQREISHTETNLSILKSHINVKTNSLLLFHLSFRSELFSWLKNFIEFLVFHAVSLFMAILI